MPSPVERLGSGGLLAVALALFAVGLARLRAFERARAPSLPWWFGYARDAANLAATLAAFGAYALAGLSGPAALVTGAGVALGLYSLDWLLGKHLGLRRSAWLLAPFGGAVAAVSILRLEAVRGFVERLLALASSR